MIGADEILARLEPLTTGSRELDALIWASTLPITGDGPDGSNLAKGYHFEYEPNEDGSVDVYATDGVTRPSIRRARRKSPAYTSSIDDAITLIPENRMWFVGHLDPTDLRFVAVISRIEGVGGESWRGVAVTPASAICIAALHARQAADG